MAIHDHGKQRGRTKFTIYDLFDFSANTANRDAVDPVTGESAYKPEEFPRMVYHPDWETRIIDKGEKVMTPFGPELLNQKSEVIWKTVSDQAQLEAALEAGWHLHPSREAEERVLGVAKKANEKVNALEDEVADLRRQLAERAEPSTKVGPPVKAKPIDVQTLQGS